ncbi:hypothetical protein C1646_771867 [Rhizophagus diaphanus]|nr:hypothetical protein C1646_771867 [Rhizophagus diaphanus] [Rhizophagus sp. MUCL 43196]
MKVAFTIELLRVKVKLCALVRKLLRVKVRLGALVRVLGNYLELELELDVLMFEEINDLDFENLSVDLPLKDEINLSECNGFEDDDEVEDSPLKELYSRQTYTSFLDMNENNEQIEYKIDVSKISNPAKHKGKGRSANKRYLSSIENYFKKYANSNSQDENMERLKKKNKRQCGICKSWYYDSRNCPLKNNKEGNACFDQENLIVKLNI